MSLEEELVEHGLKDTLHYLCAKDDSNAVNEKLQGIKKTALNKKISYFGAPLHVACTEGNLESVKLLAEAGAELEITNHVRYTPLLVALDNNKEHVADYLLGIGANPLAVGIKKLTALHIAAMRCSHEIVKKLITKGCDVNQVFNNEYDLLYLAASYGNCDVVKYLLPQEKDNTKVVKAFYGACWRNEIEVAKIMIDSTENVNNISEDYPELIFWICGNRYMDIIELLLKYNVNFKFTAKFKPVSGKAFEGTPLEYVRMRNQHDMVEFLEKL